MITLDSATQEAFARREIRIIPNLYLIVDSVNIPIPSNALISRPACSASPVVLRTPVVRMDFEVAATAEVKANITSRKEIKYEEYINGQKFDKFGGVIEHIQESWVVKDGATIETMRVTCYSQSQILKHYDFESVNNAISASEAEFKIVNLDYVIGTHVEVINKAASGGDATTMDNAFSPNVVGPSGYGRATIILADGSTKLGGSHFILVADPTNRIEVQWIIGAPATGAPYTLYCPYVVGFVVPETPVYSITTTPATPTVYKLENPGDVAYGSEFAIPMIDPANKVFKRKLSLALSKTIMYYRKGAGTGAAVAYPGSIEDWTYEFDSGYIQFFTSSSSPENFLIFSDNEYDTDDVLYVGANGLHWADPDDSDNFVETKIAAMYTELGLTTSLVASGVALGDYRMIGMKGSDALTSFQSNLPPNYIIYDAPDGVTKSVLMEQSATADFSLTQVKALRNTETPGDIYTAVRIISPISTGEDTNYNDNVNFKSRFPMTPLDPADWSDLPNVWDTDLTNYATLVASSARLVIKSCGNSNHVEKVTRLRVRFEGQLKIYRVVDRFASSDTFAEMFPLTSVTDQYLQPFVVYNVETGQAGSEGNLILDITEMMGRNIGGEHPEALVLDFRPWSGCPTVKLMRMYATIDRFTVGAAFLGDISPFDGSWGLVGISPVAGTTGYDDFQCYVKKVPESILKSWMLKPVTISDYTDAAEDTGYFTWKWWHHRVYTITDLASLRITQACEIAKEYLEDFYRRAVIQEADVVSEPQFEIGDTVQIDDPTTGESILRTIVGYRESGSWNEPMTTLELADYGA